MDIIALRFEHRADLTFNANLLLARLTWLYVNNKKHDRGALSYTGHQAMGDLAMPLPTYKRAMHDLRARGYITTERTGGKRGAPCCIKVIKGGDGRAVALSWIRGIRLLPGVKSTATALILARLLWLDSYDGSHQGRGYVTYGRAQAIKEFGISAPKYKRGMKDIRCGGLATAENDPGTVCRITVNLQTVSDLCKAENDRATGVKMIPNDVSIRYQKDTTLSIKKIPVKYQKDPGLVSKRYHPQTPANPCATKDTAKFSENTSMHIVNKSNHISEKDDFSCSDNGHEIKSLDTFLCTRILDLKTWITQNTKGRLWHKDINDALFEHIRGNRMLDLLLDGFAMPGGNTALHILQSSSNDAKTVAYVLNCIDEIALQAQNGGITEFIRSLKIDAPLAQKRIPNHKVTDYVFEQDPVTLAGEIARTHAAMVSMARCGTPVDLIIDMVVCKLWEKAQTDTQILAWFKANIMTELDTADWGCVDTAIAS